MVSAVVTGVGTAMPAAARQDDLWRDFFAEHYAGSGVARRLWEHAGVASRHTAVDPRDEDLSGCSTAARMRRFIAEALPLGKEALGACLADADLDPSEVDLLTVASCTGYATPGLDILLARDLGLQQDLQRLHVGHMGCYAAVPALAALADAAVARGKTGVLLCAELSSVHVQPATDAVDQIVAHALFSDAAAAVAVVPDGPGLELVDIAARTDVATTGLMTWDVTDLGFRMGLSPQVPTVLERHVASVVAQLLTRHGLDVQDVAAWAIHPGGPRILDVITDRLGLAEDDVAASRQTLREHGNCSSATVLLILQRLLREQPPRAGDHVVTLAFGPGLTLYAALLRQR